MKKRLLSFAIAVCMIFGCTAVLPESAFDDYIALFTSAQIGTDYEEIHKYKEIEYTVETLDLKDYRSSFTYNDDMFNVDSEKESTDLAKMSVGLAMAAYDEKVIRDCFDNMGFKYTDDTLVNYEDEKLSDYDNCDFVAFSIANKITTFNNEEYNIVVVPIRGTHGDVEWFSDFNLGLGNDHAGFYAAAGEVETKLKSFLDNYKQFDSDHTIILTTGHSRGAAVANIVAGMYSTKSRYKNYVKRNNVFSYTFACPSVSKAADTSLMNIYNYNNCGDVITALPLEEWGSLEEWGFKRFGQTKVLEARGIEYENFQLRFLEASGINYAGMTETKPWVDTFKTLASSQKVYNDPERQLLFKLVAVSQEDRISGMERMNHFNYVLNDYAIAGGNPVNLVIIRLMFNNIIGLISVEIDAYIAAFISAVSIGVSGSVQKYRIESELQDYIDEIDNMLKETKDYTSDEFDKYIKNHSGISQTLELITQLTIKNRADLLSIKYLIVEAMNSISSLSSMIVKVVELFYTSKHDSQNPNANSPMVALEHGHTPLTYILWINSIYYGANGWSRDPNSQVDNLFGLIKYPIDSIPDNITTLGYGCFNQNNSIEFADIPSGVKHIGDYCFYFCSNLKQLSIPATVDELEPYTFKYCKNLEKVSIPCDLSTENWCFEKCSNVNTINYTYGRTGKMLDSVISYDLQHQAQNSLKTVIFDDNITHIGNSVFGSVVSLSNVRLPSKLKSIGNDAFNQCSSLKRIELPESLETLGSSCFYSSGIEQIKIPSKVSVIPSQCFLNCNGLTSLVIPETISTLGNQAFGCCKGLKSVTIACDLSTENRCFSECSNVNTIHYTYGKSGKMLDSDGFYDLQHQAQNSLKTVIFDDNITHIGNSVFGSVVSLSNVRLPSKLKSIGDGAFISCTSLKQIELPESLETLGSSCFYSSGIEQIKIPSKVSVIPSQCFSYCNGLTSLVIPETISTLGNQAFGCCKGLKSVTIACDLSTENGCFSECSNVNTINFTYGRTGKMLDSVISYDLQHQAQYSLKTVIFDDNITHIGNSVFDSVVSLSNVRLPSKLKSIGDCAFRSCTSLKQIELPESLETLGSSCFYSSGIEQIKIPSKVSVIPSQCFSYCNGLTSLVIPETISTLGNQAFYYCTGLKSVTIACDLSTKDECFCGCSNVNTINYTYGRTGKMLDSDGYYDLQHQISKSLKIVILDDDITHIGDNAFCYNTALNNVKLPSKIKSIGTYAFYNCSGLTKITIPNSIQNINAYAFHKCDELKSVIYNGHKQEWDRISIGEHNEPLENVQFKPCEHNYTAVVTTPATCTTDGVRTYTCSKCNDSYIEIINAAGHKLGDWTETTKPTCTAKGVETRKCENCDKSEIRDADALGHDYVETVVSPTCTTKGYTNHKCSRCNDEYNDTETDMVAHKFGEWIVTTKPTCTAKGVETRKCENCDKTETRDVDVIAHTFSDWDIKSYDSKTGESKLERKCINCTHNETKTEKNTVQRYAGSGRFATAAEISKASFETAKTVVLAYGLNSADALAGVPLAAKYNAPILLTNTKTLPQETLAEIKRLKAANVIILGGEGAIGSGVENLLKKEGLTTQRIAGKTRFGTATAIAEQLTENPEKIFFVYAFNFADALSASTVAAIKGAPIIYLKTNGDIDADTAAYLAKVKGKVKKAYVIGGTGVISDDMMNKAKNALGLDTITRVAGANRYATCIEVNNTFKDYLTGNGICVAKGLDFPDALAGGVFAALKKMPLFLADGNLKDVQTGYLGNKDISNVYVFGGTGAVPDELIEKLAKAS